METSDTPEFKACSSGSSKQGIENQDGFGAVLFKSEPAPEKTLAATQEAALSVQRMCRLGTGSLLDHGYFTAVNVAKAERLSLIQEFGRHNHKVSDPKGCQFRVLQLAGIKSVDLVSPSCFHSSKACRTMWPKARVLDLSNGAGHSWKPPDAKERLSCAGTSYRHLLTRPRRECFLEGDGCGSRRASAAVPTAELCRTCSGMRMLLFEQQRQ